MARAGGARFKSGAVDAPGQSGTSVRRGQRSSVGLAASRPEYGPAERNFWGYTMKRMFGRLKTFYTLLKGCLREAWQDTDSRYHIPKSRFKDQKQPVYAAHNDPPRRWKMKRNAFVGSFRDCVITAWEASDKKYHIPKSRYRSGEQGVPVSGSGAARGLTLEQTEKKDEEVFVVPADMDGAGAGEELEM